MLLREVAYARPATVEEAVDLLAEHDGARALAGGQTLVNVMKQRAASPDVLVDLARAGRAPTIAVSADESALEIGAMATLLLADALLGGRGDPPDPRRGGGDRRRRPGAKPRDARRQHLRQRSDEPLSAAARGARRVDDDPRRAGRARPSPPRSSSSASSRPRSQEGELLTRISVPAGGKRAPATGWRASRSARTARTSRTRPPPSSTVPGASRSAASRPCRSARPRSSSASPARTLDEASARAAVEGLGATLDPPSDVHASADYRRSLAETSAARAVLQAAERAKG